VPLNDNYLQMLQSNVARMAGQSTTIKGWCVTLTAALLGFGATTTALVAGLAIYVILVFAALDAYYLTLERSYRTLYTHALQEPSPSWNLTPKRPAVAEVGRALAAPAIAILYGTSLLVATIFTICTATQR
jgi:hypothetical protein